MTLEPSPPGPPPTDPETLRELARVAGEASGARRVMLFGSVARGEARPESDLDLLLVFDDDFFAGHESAFDMIAPAAEADAALGERPYRVDLVPMRLGHLERGESVLARAVLREGQTLYERPTDAPRPTWRGDRLGALLAPFRG